MADTKVALSLSKNYVSHWTWREAVREILQNALDCKKYTIETEVNEFNSYNLVISTYDGSISRQALLLGESGKHNNDTIGKYGEGLKLALLIFAREDIGVEVQSGRDLWVPKLEYSETFMTDSLNICITEDVFPENDQVVIKITGLTSENIDEVDMMYLSDEVRSSAIASFDGCSMFYKSSVYPEWQRSGAEDDEDTDVFKPRAYCGGLYVCDLPDGFEYSYDFCPKQVELDRDRKTVNTWDVQYNISRLLMGAGRADIAIRLMERHADDIKGYGEHVYVSSMTGTSSSFTFKDKLREMAVESFKIRNGNDAIPISMTMAEKEKRIMTSSIVKAGFTPVVVSSHEYAMLNKAITLPDNFVLATKPDVPALLHSWLQKYELELSSGATTDLNAILTQVEEWTSITEGDKK